VGNPALHSGLDSGECTAKLCATPQATEASGTTSCVKSDGKALTREIPRARWGTDHILYNITNRSVTFVLINRRLPVNTSNKETRVFFSPL